ncbi:hypothetical protein KBD08_04045 [Candidatus Babeliales bacterium]|nr:hypothetical protein [Candidatus Babeliales bacterium]
MFQKIASIFTCSLLLFIAGCGDWCGCCKPTKSTKKTTTEAAPKSEETTPDTTMLAKQTPAQEPADSQPEAIEPNIVMPKDM